ncbi:hypothetical protein Bca52824_037377 [Brassica carinata]|uniref:Uncharacterized protein n=1 Tax=Brassica carinata TaxID=52824 RepID=A0A8X7S6M9_BRACI|nr:hypothetical protein Bca52824_037377 [Brassica carinata]
MASYLALESIRRDALATDRLWISFDVVKGSAEVLYMRRSAAYQAMKRYNIIVLLSEETVAHRQARALERVRICNRNTAQISIDDKDNIYMML